MAHSDRDTSHQEGLGWWEMSFLSSPLPWWLRALQIVDPEGDRGTEALLQQWEGEREWHWQSW